MLDSSFRVVARSVLPRRLRLRANIFLLSVTFSIFSLSCPRSCFIFCSHGIGSAVPPRVAPPIFRLRGESGAYSQAPLLSPAFRGGTPVLVSWPLVRTVWLVNSTGSAPPMPSAMPLCLQHAWTPYGLLTHFHGGVHPGRAAAGAS